MVLVSDFLKRDLAKPVFVCDIKHSLTGVWTADLKATTPVPCSADSWETQSRTEEGVKDWLGVWENAKTGLSQVSSQTSPGPWQAQRWGSWTACLNLPGAKP